MSTAPSPASTPSPPSNSTASPPPAAPPPATPSPVPPVTPSAPPPTTPSAPPPATPSAPPPATPSAASPATPPAAPPSTPPTPPPAKPSVPLPATPSAPPPATPLLPPPATPSPPAPEVTAPPPATTTSPPPASTPATPSPPPPTAKSPPPPPTTVPSTPAAKSPPLPARRSPTTPSGTTPSLSSSSSSGGGVSMGLVVGVAVGAGVVLVLLTLLFLCCRKKRRRYDDGDEYYAHGPRRPPPMPYGQKDNNGGPPRQWQYNAPPAEEHVVNVVLKPTLPPPPLPPFMSSSGGSGSNYSGSEQPFAPSSPGIALGFAKSTFTYEELMLATNGFSDANLLGQGGFGYVHKGVLPNGKEVAVKKLKAGSGQGEREFHAEVEIISRVHHKHLVSLVGYCITRSQLMLVYEFLPNNTLEFHLHGKGRPTIDWPTRLRIALGSAKGLAYLHEDCHPKIIHRDIKAANILLDFKFEAKVADFGLAKFTSDANTHVSTRVMGTFEYLAPEYASSGKLTEKSDVFSFGVMLLELITGRRPVDTTNTYMDDSLVDWARPQLTRALEDGNFDSLVDPKLQSYYNHREMARMVACAAACVRHSARRRPRMSQIVRALEGDVSLSDLNERIRPGQSGVYSSCGSSDYDNSQYNEDLKRFRKVAMASQEYGSSEYSEPTSEYGVYPSGSSTEQTTREMEMARRMKGSSSQGFSGGGQRY